MKILNKILKLGLSKQLTIIIIMLAQYAIKANLRAIGRSLHTNKSMAQFARKKEPEKDVASENYVR